MPLERSKTQNDTPTIKDAAFQRIKLISESTQYFFMIFFLNWKVISSRPSFQLSSHLEYVFILKKIFQKLFLPRQSLFIIADRVYLALLTASTVIGVMTGGHLIRWPKYLTALTKLEIRSDRVNSNSILVHTSTCFYFYQLTSSVNSAWNHLIVMAAPPNNNGKKEKSLEVMKSLIEKEISLLQTHYNWFNKDKFYRHWYIHY